MAFRLHCQNEPIYHKKLVFIKQKASFGDCEWFMVLGFSWNPKLSLNKFPLSIVFRLWKLPCYFTQLLLFTVPSRKKIHWERCVFFTDDFSVQFFSITFFFNSKKLLKDSISSQQTPGVKLSCKTPNTVVWGCTWPVLQDTLIHSLWVEKICWVFCLGIASQLLPVRIKAVCEDIISACCCCCCCCKSCPILSNPIDGSPLGSPVPGILQARTLEWVAISFSKSFQLKQAQFKYFLRVRRKIN